MLLSYRQHPTNFVKARAEAIEISMRKPVRELLQGLKWMDSETKEKALQKLDNMTAVISYHKDILDNRMINKLYGDFRMSNGSFLRKYLSLNKFSWAIEGKNSVSRIGSCHSSSEHMQWAAVHVCLAQ